MRNQPIRTLAECSEFRQTVEARPPRVVHGTAMIVTSLVTVAVAWAALAKANLIVRAEGKVGPVTPASKVFNAVGGEMLKLTSGGRVAAVHFRLGDHVKKGDELITLDVAQLDNEMAKRERIIQAGQDELARIAQTEQLMPLQYEATRKVQEAELRQAEEEVRLAKEKRTAELKAAGEELKKATDDAEDLRRLVLKGAASRKDVAEAESRMKVAQAKVQSIVNIDEQKVEVLRAKLVLTEKDHALKLVEMARNKAKQQADVDTARRELKALEMERERSVLRATTDGVVTAGEIKPGDVLEPGKPVIEVAEEKGFLFEAMVPADEVGHLSVGLPVRIKLGAYDHQKYGTVPGKVTFISPDSRTVEQKGAKPLMGYLVRVAVEASEVGRGDLKAPLQFGLTGQAEIVTGQESILMLFVRKVRQAISLS